MNLNILNLEILYTPISEGSSIIFILVLYNNLSYRKHTFIFGIVI